MQKLEIVVGGQYGSEAKGHVTAQLVANGIEQSDNVREQTGGEIDPTIVNIRVAGPNAGHTVYDSNGEKFALRQVPVGAAIDDRVVLYIAPGSEVEPEVLFDEILKLRDAGHTVENLYVSGEATLIDPHHKATEAGLVGKIGSTGKGIGAARADRLLRGARRVKDDAELVEKLWAVGVNLANPEDLYNDDTIAEQFPTHIIIEGTQGYGLSLHKGHYPQVTSSDCTAIDFLSMAGISPWRAGIVELTVYVVARAFPIRVAGNSGPMKGETSWDELGLEAERTTVTQKIRRVGEWDSELVRKAVRDNGGRANVEVVLTMADQVFPEIAGWAGLNSDEYRPELLAEVEEWAASIEDQVGARVTGITTSPQTMAWTTNGSGIRELQAKRAELLASIQEAAETGDFEDFEVVINDNTEGNNA